MITIAERIERARLALDTYRDSLPDYKDRPEEPDEQAITDLIADLLHLARGLGEKEPEQILVMAEIHFNSEEDEEREEEEA